MKLTKDMKDAIRGYLVEKSAPLEEYERLCTEFLTALDGDPCPEWRESLELAKTEKPFVEISKAVLFAGFARLTSTKSCHWGETSVGHEGYARMRVGESRILRDNLSFTVCEDGEVTNGWDVEFSPALLETVRQMARWTHRRSAAEKDADTLLAVADTTAKMRKLVPELDDVLAQVIVGKRMSPDGGALAEHVAYVERIMEEMA